jgi:hypothetical protein
VEFSSSKEIAIDFFVLAASHSINLQTVDQQASSTFFQHAIDNSSAVIERFRTCQDLLIIAKAAYNGRRLHMPC